MGAGSKAVCSYASTAGSGAGALCGRVDRRCGGCLRPRRFDGEGVLLKLPALSGAESDDAADRVVWGYADGNSVTRNNFDSEPPHPAAQLRQHFMSGIALHAVQTARMNRNYGSLHVYQIVFAQSGSLWPKGNVRLGPPVPSGRVSRSKQGATSRSRLQVTCFQRLKVDDPA